METIEGSIAVNPYRAGKPPDEPFDGFYVMEILTLNYAAPVCSSCSAWIPAEALLTRQWMRYHCQPSPTPQRLSPRVARPRAATRPGS